jgi:hypothetical protein
VVLIDMDKSTTAIGAKTLDIDDHFGAAGLQTRHQPVQYPLAPSY